MAHLRRLWTFAPKFACSLPASRRHSAIDWLSSTAVVPPENEDEMNECAASPTWTIRPLGLVHLGCGSRQQTFHRTSRCEGIFRIASMSKGSQLPGSGRLFRTSSDVRVWDQDSSAVPSSCGSVCQRD